MRPTSIIDHLPVPSAGTGGSILIGPSEDGSGGYSVWPVTSIHTRIERWRPDLTKCGQGRSASTMGSASNSSIRAEAIRLKYPDGSHDAETLLAIQQSATSK